MGVTRESVRVVVAQQDARGRQATTSALSRAGYEVITAQSAEEALELVRAHRPPVVLVDLELAGLDALAIARRIKSDPALAGVSVMLLGPVRPAAIDADPALSQVIDGYLVAPVAEHDLISRVRAQVRQSELTAKLRASEALSESRQVFAVARDVTQHRGDLAREQQSQRLERLAGRMARLGGWSVDVAGETVAWSDEVCAIHEVPVGQSPALSDGIGYYAPEHRAELERAVRACLQDGEPMDLEAQIITAKGNRRWVRVIGEAVRDASAKVAQIHGAIQDIDDRRKVEASLRASEGLFRAVSESSWDVFHLVDSQGTILYESPAVTRVLGYRPDEMVGRMVLDFVHPDDVATIVATPSQLSPSAPQVTVLRVRHKDGTWRWVESYEVNLFEHPDVAAVAVNYRDITERKLAEEALHASEIRFGAMVNSIAQLAWIASRDGYIHWYNQRWYDYTGTTPEQMEGWGWQSVHDPHRLPQVRELWRAAIEAGEPLEIEFPLRGADGVFRTFLTRAVPIRDGAGKVVQWVGTNTDVDELKRVESSLRRSEARLKDAQRIARVGSWDWNIATGALEWSDQILRLFGIAPGAFGRDYDSFLRGVHPDDRERTHQAVQDALAGRAPYDVEHRTVWPDGTVRVVHEQGEVTRDAAGVPVRMAGTVLDITERKQAETRLAESNRALRLLSRCNEALVRSEHEEELLATICRIAVEEGGFPLAWVGYALDDDGKTVSPRAHAGIASEYLSRVRISWSDDTPNGRGPVGRSIRSGEAVVIADLSADPRFAPWLDDALASGFRGVVSLPLANGGHTFGALVLCLAEVRVIEEHELRVLRELAADLAFGIMHLRSQVERSRLQEALRQVAASTSASIGAHFFERLTTSMTEAVGAQAGFVARLLPGQPLSARTIATVLDGVLIPSFDYSLAGTPCELLTERDDCVVSSHANAQFPHAPLITSMGAQAYVGRRLDDSRGRTMGIVGVLFRAPLKSTEFVSSTLQIFATRAAAELERQKVDARLREQASLLNEAQDAILVRDLEQRVLYWNRSAEKRYGWSAEEALGRPVTELIHDDVAELEAATEATIARGEWVGELQHRTKQGEPITVEGRLTLMRDDDGAPRSILAVHTDITVRKKLERTEDQLRQAQKMEAIGSLAGGVAHDFNNLLSVILSYADLIISDLQATDPMRVDLEEVKKAGLRATELTHQLLAFSRKQILQPVVLDLNHVVVGVEKMLRRLLGEDIEVSLVTSSALGRIHADAGQLEQVLMNLVVNARDAMPEGGNLTIETANTVLDEHYAAAHAGVSPGPYVMLAVSDSGVGMDRETQARIFEPFFTTKDKSKGTGLGLSTVYGIVQQSGGHIWVYSEAGKGTTFKIYLPRSDLDLTAPSVAPGASTSLRGTETILVVEDEAQVRNILRTILCKHGYHVLEAQNGGEAILICEQFGAAIHLLLTDVVMPRMSGRQLAERIGPLRPSMKVLFVSGYTENTIVHHGVLDAGIEFLAKPIMPEALLTKVRSVLDGRVS